jgi:hypothetical protein
MGSTSTSTDTHSHSDSHIGVHHQEHTLSGSGSGNGSGQENDNAASSAADPLAALKKSLSLSGRVITPHDTPAYDIERHTFTLNHCYSPSLIIVCASTSDVVQAVRYCRSTGQDFTVAGGM